MARITTEYVAEMVADLLVGERGRREDISGHVVNVDTVENMRGGWTVTATIAGVEYDINIQRSGH